MISSHVKAAVLILVTSGAIKNWTPGENITTTDLNAALNHIHTKMVGGHGARLVDADVSAAAAISTSKLAAYRNIPVAWGITTAVCAASPCTIVSSNGVTSITRTGVGIYVVTLSAARPNVSYNPIVAPIYHTGGVETLKICALTGGSLTTTTFGVECLEAADGTTAANGSFSFVVYDND